MPKISESTQPTTQQNRSEVNPLDTTFSTPSHELAPQVRELMSFDLATIGREHRKAVQIVNSLKPEQLDGAVQEALVTMYQSTGLIPVKFAVANALKNSSHELAASARTLLIVERDKGDYPALINLADATLPKTRAA